MPYETHQPVPVVLDASAGVEIALWTDDGSRPARHILDADEIAVPDHFHLERAAALRRMELRGELDAADAETALRQILALRVRRVDTTPLLPGRGACAAISPWPTRCTSSSRDACGCAGHRRHPSRQSSRTRRQDAHFNAVTAPVAGDPGDVDAGGCHARPGLCYAG